MIGTGLLGTLLLGTGYIYPVGAFTGDIAYNGYEFLRVNKITNRYDRAGIDLSTYTTIKTDGRGYDISTMDTKEYVITGRLVADTSEALGVMIDDMIKAMNEPNALLQVKRRDGTMTVVNATCTSVSLPEEHYNITQIPYEVTITCLDPFMYEEELIEESRAYIAPGSNSFTVTAGNEKAKPFVLIVCDVGTSVSSISIDVNGTAITCPIALTNGDSFLLNAKNKEVSLNGSQNFEFVGEFPSLQFGTNTINISYTGTLACDVYLLYYPTYA